MSGQDKRRAGARRCKGLVGPDCCGAPALAGTRLLTSTSRRDLEVQRCTSCSAWWLVELEEIAMNDDFEELHFDRYAKLTDDEAASVTAETDLTFLDDRPVLASVQHGVLAWCTGWRR